MSDMQNIGVGELRRDASRWLARVRAGETFLITDRGRPVAQLAPLAQSGGYEALSAMGGIAPGTGRAIEDVLVDLDANYPPDEGPSVWGALMDLRDGER